MGRGRHGGWRAALGGVQPDVVLIDRSPEADGLAELADPEMWPPVALPCYMPRGGGEGGVGCAVGFGEAERKLT